MALQYDAEGNLVTRTPGQVSDPLANATGNHYRRTGSGPSWLNEAAGRVKQTAGRLESTFGGGSKSSSSQPTQTTVRRIPARYSDQAQTPSQPGKLETPGTGEQFWSENKDKWSAPGRASQAYDGLDPVEYNPTGASKSAYEQWMERTSGAGPGNALADNRGTFEGIYGGPSRLEQLYDGGEGERGLDQIYGRRRDVGGRELGDRLAAMGLDQGTEAAIRANQEFEADLAAEQAQALINLAGDADAMGLDRGRFGVDFLGAMQDQGNYLDERDLGIGRDTFDMGERLDRLGMDEAAFQQGLNERQVSLADQVDRGEERRLGAGLDAAFRNQDAFQDRERGALLDMLGATGQYTGDASPIVDARIREYVQSELEMINGLLAEGKMTAEQANQRRQEIFDIFGLAGQMYTEGQ